MIPIIPNTVAFSKPALVASRSDIDQRVGERNDAALPVVWYRPKISPSRLAGANLATNVLEDA